MMRFLIALFAATSLGCQGIGKLDLTTLGRDSWQRPDDVVAALEIEPGDRVADLGVGDGYFIGPLAAAVGEAGMVYAVDVEEAPLATVRERFPAGETVVDTVLAGFDDPRLPDGSIDLVLIVNTFHHIEDRGAYFRRLRDDLAAGGRVAVIEPNEDLGGVLGLTLDEGHTSSAPAVEQEMASAGYTLVASHDFLPVQIFRVFAPGEQLSAIPDAPGP